MPHTYYLSIGTNLGDRISNLETAISKLSYYAIIIAKSSYYITEPWGYHDDYDYINMALKIKTNLIPIKLLQKLKKIEKNMGRKPNFLASSYTARIIDLDILFFNSDIFNSDSLIIPHPKLYDRNYVLEPICEISPDLKCPITHKKMTQLLLDSKDLSKVSLYTH